MFFFSGKDTTNPCMCFFAADFKHLWWQDIAMRRRLRGCCIVVVGSRVHIDEYPLSIIFQERVRWNHGFICLPLSGILWWEQGTTTTVQRDESNLRLWEIWQLPSCSQQTHPCLDFCISESQNKITLLGIMRIRNKCHRHICWHGNFLLDLWGTQSQEGTEGTEGTTWMAADP